MATQPPHSPCTSNCCLDHDDLCVGCFRTLTEIMSWHCANVVEREAIVQRSDQRRLRRKRRGALTIQKLLDQPSGGQ